MGDVRTDIWLFSSSAQAGRLKPGKCGSCRVEEAIQGSSWGNGTMCGMI